MIYDGYVEIVQFRALSDQLYRSPGYYEQLRRVAVDQLGAHADRYSPYVAGDWGDYLRQMAKSGTWGDHLTLQVLSCAFREREMKKCRQSERLR